MIFAAAVIMTAGIVAAALLLLLDGGDATADGPKTSLGDQRWQHHDHALANTGIESVWDGSSGRMAYSGSSFACGIILGGPRSFYSTQRTSADRGTMMLRARRGRCRTIMAIILLLITSVAVIAIIWVAGGFDGACLTETAGLHPRAEKASENTIQVTFIPAFTDLEFDEVLIVIEHGGHASDPASMAPGGGITVGAFTVNLTDLAGDGRIDQGDRVYDLQHIRR